MFIFAAIVREAGHCADSGSAADDGVTCPGVVEVVRPCGYYRGVRMCKLKQRPPFAEWFGVKLARFSSALAYRCVGIFLIAAHLICWESFTRGLAGNLACKLMCGRQYLTNAGAVYFLIRLESKRTWAKRDVCHQFGLEEGVVVKICDMILARFYDGAWLVAHFGANFGDIGMIANKQI